MTRDEERFYLREIHGHWSEPRISADKMRELKGAELIEIATDELSSVRLTRAGQRVKLESRPADVPAMQTAPRRVSRSHPSRPPRPSRPRKLV